MSDTTTTETIPKARLDAEIQKRREVEEKLAAAEASIKGIAKERDTYKATAAGVEAQEAALTKLRAELDAAKGQGAADLAMADAGIKDRSVRDFLRFQHGQHASEAGEKALDFGAWFEGRLDSPDPVLAAALPQQQAPSNGVEHAEAPSAPAGPPRTEAGVKPSPSPPSPYAPGQIAAMSREEFAAHKDELLRGLGRVM